MLPICQKAGVTSFTVITSITELPFSVNSDKPKTSKLTKLSGSSDIRECFCCHETGHLIVACPVLKKKNKFRQQKSVGFVRTVGTESYEIDSVFEPFIGQGMILISGLEEDQVPVTWLRDTGTAQSFILEGALPFFKGNVLWLRCFSAGN